jgi:hypothetical protein
LSSGRPDSWALASIQHSELQRGKIRRSAHYSAEGVDFTNDSALRHPANCGIAGHLADSLECAGNQANSGADACCCNCCLSAGVTAADYDDVELVFN